jgi:GMP synthase-like glutamine amidotransferase
MRIVCLQHVEFEGPAGIAKWATSRGHTLRTVHVYKNEALPEPEDFELLVLMGGPMSVNDEDQHAWLRPEKSLINDALDARRRVLGICLGAQLIASALGARVRRNMYKEIGWLPIERVAGPAADILDIGIWPEIFHWHGETFDLPNGASLWARSAGCANQAFLYQRQALAMQFHIEVTPESARLLIKNAGNEIGSGPFEQPADTLAGDPERFKRLEPLLTGLLDRFVALQAV